MKKFILSLIILFHFNAKSQNTESSAWLFKLDVPHLFYDFSFPKVQISAEKKLTPYFSLIGEVGYQFYSSEGADTIFVKPRGFRIAIESRLYVLKLFDKETKRKHPGLFLGLEGFYRANQQNNSVSYYAADSENRFVDDFTVKKRVHGANVTTGYQLNIPRRDFFIVLEPHLGFGIMNKHIKNGELDFRQNIDEDLAMHSYGVEDEHYESSAGIQFNFNIGVRLGFRLRRIINE